MASFKEFIEWNKKVFNDPTPIAGSQHIETDEYEEFKLFLPGLKCHARKQKKKELPFR